MSDFNDMKEILEMAEVLDAEFDKNLVCKTVNISNDDVVNVTFTFNDAQELIGMYVEND